MNQVATVSVKEQFLADFDELQSRAAPDWLKTLRADAAARYRRLEFPTLRTEAWRYTSLKPILSTEFRTTIDAPTASSEVASSLYNKQDWTELVFVDGAYSKDLSRIGKLPHGVAATSLAEAILSGNKHATNHLNSCAAESDSIFAALNTAFIQDGAFVYIPKNTVLETPIHIVHLTVTSEVSKLTHPRVLVIADESAEATIIETYAVMESGVASFKNVNAEYVLHANAKIKRYKVSDEGEAGYQIATTRIRQEADSSFESYVFTLDGGIVRDEITSALDGEGATCSLNGLYLGRGEQAVDNATAIEHRKPHCSSWIGYKGVLDDASHAAFSGKIVVHRNAQKTDSKQLNSNLLLSDRATINTKPLLEILADDVKCTHGATIGQHPQELIFYFQSRGISEAAARSMLTYGFAGEIINKTAVEPLRKRLDRYVFNRFSPRIG